MNDDRTDEAEAPLQQNEPILVSACLLGVACRYDGASKACPKVLSLAGRHAVVPVCPEQLGGLPTPRVRHERVGPRVISERGDDATAVFERGAREALRIARVTTCKQAVLKARSPSCGVGRIYDGTFSGRVIEGHGVLAELLLSLGFLVYTEEDLP